MLLLLNDLNLHTIVLLPLILIFVLFYEFINGFHDTANVVATIIYTHAMRLRLAIIMAALFNFLGVILSGLSVAYAILHMLPIDLLLNASSDHILTIVFSLLFAATTWNLSTWYLGLPVSSSHTLIGAIIGIGLTNALTNNISIINALNLTKVKNILFSLILSPILGLVIAGSLVFILRICWNRKKKKLRIHFTSFKREKRSGKKKPPFWIRTILIFSAIGVAFSHGANDGQKGIGLVMLVLIGVVPVSFAININASRYEIIRTKDALINIENYFQQHHNILRKVFNINHNNSLSETGKNISLNKLDYNIKNIVADLEIVKNNLSNIENYKNLSVNQRIRIRRTILYISDITDKIIKIPETSYEDRLLIKRLKEDILNTVEYAPIWITTSVALALGIGTMIGWNRITKTIGEKIGKKSLTYAQGICAQITAAFSIGLASYSGIPVSTTQVISSSVAGAMLVDGNSLQLKTITNILVAWLLTLPVSILLSSIIYLILLIFIK